MIKLSANLSKKLPVPSIDFSSQQFGAALEVEVADTADEVALAEKLQKMYRLLERSIDQQIAGANGTEAQTPPSSTPPSRRAAVGGNGSNGHASPAQVKAIFAISKDRGMARDALTDLLRDEFNVEKPEDLTLKEASDLISRLQARGRARA